MAENTLWGGGAKSVVTLYCFPRVSNFNHGDMEHIFPKKLHNMIYYNTNNSITKNFLFFPTYIVRFQNIFVAKNCTTPCIKNANILKK